MDHKQLEEKLTEAYQKGREAGREEAGCRNWRKAVEETLEETKGIGPGRKALFMERLDRKTGGQQDSEKLQ